MYSEARTIASISINGGSYTEYGKMEGTSDTLYVIGNKAYFIGGEEHYEEIGLVEYDLSTKRGRVVKEDYEIYDFGTAGEILIFENYDYDAEKLVSLTVYYSKTNTFKEIKVS